MIISCNGGNNKAIGDNDKNGYRIDESLANAIDEYISYKPIKMNYGEKLTQYYEKGFSHPSYHIYFDKKGKDTIFSITILPQLHTFEFDPIPTGDKDEFVYHAIYPKGFFTYKNKYPVIVFDKKSIANKLYNREVLRSISDTLITTSIDDVRHYKPYFWKYRIKNGKISERISDEN